MKKPFVFILASALALTACSFQKNPDKTPPPTPEPVKVGMTRDELKEEVLKIDGATFPDRLKFAISQKDEEVFTKVLLHAADEELNTYSQNGETALEILVKSNAVEWVLYLLGKGASPYKPHQHTTSGPMQMMSGVGQYRETLKFIDEKDQAFYQKGVSANDSGISAFISFYNETRFPLTKEVQGKRLIDAIIESHDRPEFIGNGMTLRKECTDYYAPFFAAVEHLEGPLGVSGEGLIRLAKTVKSDSLLTYALSKSPSMSERELFEKIKTTSVDWIAKVAYRFKDHQNGIEETLLKNIVAMDAKSLRQDLRECYSANVIKSSFPAAFKELEKKADPRHIEELFSNCLPGAKAPTTEELQQNLLKGQFKTIEACYQ